MAGAAGGHAVISGGGGGVLTSHDGADGANEGDQLLFGAGILSEAAQLVSAADWDRERHSLTSVNGT